MIADHGMAGALATEILDQLHREDSAPSSDARRSNIRDLIDRLADLPDAPAVQRVLEEWMTDSYAPHRRTAARVLRTLIKKFPDEYWHAYTERLSIEDDPETQEWLLVIARDHDRSDLMPLLGRFVFSPIDDVRALAPDAISASCPEGLTETGLEWLLLLADDQQPDVQFSAVFELAEWWARGFRDPRIRALLTAHADSEDPRLVEVISEDTLASLVEDFRPIVKDS